MDSTLIFSRPSSNQIALNRSRFLRQVFIVSFSLTQIGRFGRTSVNTEYDNFHSGTLVKVQSGLNSKEMMSNFPWRSGFQGQARIVTANDLPPAPQFSEHHADALDTHQRPQGVMSLPTSVHNPPRSPNSVTLLPLHNLSISPFRAVRPGGRVRLRKSNSA